MAQDQKNVSIHTPKGRMCFASLFRARVNENSDDQTPKYGCTLIFDKAAQATPQFLAMKKAAAEAAKEKWGDKVPANLRSPFRPGSDKDLDKYPEFGDGAVFVNVSTKQRPGVVYPYIDAATGKPKKMEDDTDIKSGDFVRGSLTVYAYEQKGNKGVAFGLRNIQLLEEGEALGGRTSAEDDFDAVDGATSPEAMFD